MWSYLLLTLFWSRGIVTSLTGSRGHWIPRVKISVQISTFYFNYLWSYLLLTLFWSRGIVTSLTGSNFDFLIFDFITAFLVSKLVQVPNFNFLFQLFVKLFAFDPFLVPGDCDVTNGVKFWNFWYLGFITEFLVSKLVQVSNFNFLFQLFVKLFAFDPFLVPGDCDVTNGVKFWNF